ncbi:MAG: aminotransferase class V-fold PLP-dependent enzyme, partial [Candidatus Aminicenantaceae bacterium]
MKGKYVYLDNAAATRMDEKVLEAMRPYFFDIYAVASSEFGYSLGIQSREAMDKARESLAARLNADSECFIFTSGSTESSNTAIKGTALASAGKKGKHLVVSRIEDFPVLHS